MQTALVKPGSGGWGWRGAFALGFLYWLSFVMVLEPGNLARAATPPALSLEGFRMVVAGLLGAAVTPAIFALVNRFPMEGTARWRHGLIHIAADAGFAMGLITTGCVLASLFLPTEHRPLLVALRQQLTVDSLLMFFCVAALTAMAHAGYYYRKLRAETVAAPAAPTSTYRNSVLVQNRNSTTLLDLAEVDWIETQGNYLALHAGTAVHLIRETAARFEATLDPERFVRVHRQTIVAVDRIRALTGRAGGDATLRLSDETELRVSRNFREAVRARLEAA